MALTYRSTKESALTIAELDGNFQFLTGSHELSGSLTSTGLIVTGSINSSGSFIINSSSADTTFKIENLPTSPSGLTTGSLWISGSSIDSSISSSFLMVVNP